MFPTKFKASMALFMAVTMIGLLGGILIAHRLLAEGAVSVSARNASNGPSGEKDADKTKAPPPERPKTDQELIQGKWKSISWEDNGRKDQGTTAVFEFKKDRLTIAMEIVSAEGKITKKEFALTFKLDPTKKPRWIDMHDPKKNSTLPGIYHVDKDKLRICFDENDGGKRANAFTSERAPSPNDV